MTKYAFTRSLGRSSLNTEALSNVCCEVVAVISTTSYMDTNPDKLTWCLCTITAHVRYYGSWAEFYQCLQERTVLCTIWSQELAGEERGFWLGASAIARCLLKSDADLLPKQPTFGGVECIENRQQPKDKTAVRSNLNWGGLTQSTTVNTANGPGHAAFNGTEIRHLRTKFRFPQPEQPFRRRVSADLS